MVAVTRIGFDSHSVVRGNLELLLASDLALGRWDRDNETALALRVCSASESVVDLPGFVLISNRSLLLVFVGAWLLFYLLLVRWLRLGKVGWKRTDYFWLSLAAVGLIGTVGESRRQAAEIAMRSMEPRRAAVYQQFNHFLDSFSGEYSYLCRQFVKSEWVTQEAIDKANAEWAVVCKWFRDVRATVPQEPPAGVIDRDAFPARPSPIPQGTEWNFQVIDQYVADYNEAVLSLEQARLQA